MRRHDRFDNGRPSQSGLLPIDPTDARVAARIVAIQRAAYAVEAELIGFDGIPQLSETRDDVRQRTDLVWMGAFDGDVLVGLIAWEIAVGSTGDLVDIDRLAVDPAHARRGHGRRLVRAVPHAFLTTVCTGEANHPAITLYLSEGFVPTEPLQVQPGVRLAQLRRVGRDPTVDAPLLESGSGVADTHRA